MMIEATALPRKAAPPSMDAQAAELRLLTTAPVNLMQNPKDLDIIDFACVRPGFFARIGRRRSSKSLGRRNL
jgi:hypothetical protein